MTPSDFDEHCQDCLERVNQTLEHILEVYQDTTTPLHKALHYSVFNGGKRFRAILAYIMGKVLNLPSESLDASACAIELIHAYSLVHDDLPAMDNDDMRRGKPTNHKVFGEAIAILVGDALQSMAFEVLSSRFNPLNDSLKLQQIKALARASGPTGMIWGQSLDMTLEGKKASLAQLEQLHAHKTGALFLSCIELPLIAANTEPKIRRLFFEFGQHIGLAFQVQDDILEKTASSEQLGKNSHSDEVNKKSTFVTLLGLEKAKLYAKDLMDSAIQSIAPYDPNLWLSELAQRFVLRNC